MAAYEAEHGLAVVSAGLGGERQAEVGQRKAVVSFFPMRGSEPGTGAALQWLLIGWPCQASTDNTTSFQLRTRCVLHGIPASSLSHPFPRGGLCKTAQSMCCVNLCYATRLSRVANTGG